ncbi:MarR family winged helix-turn-helix transcriptional regulator [Streptacidiphilus sp. PAMC 29251]
MSAENDPVDWSRQQWIAHDQPEPDKFTAMVALLRTHQAMCAALDSTLRAHGLTRTGYLLMTTLMLSREGTRPLGQLSRHLMIHPTTVTLALDQLEKRGLLRRQPHPTDRRTILATLTPAGQELLDQATASLAGSGYGLAGVSDALSLQVTDVLRDVRGHLGDIGSIG